MKKFIRKFKERPRYGTLIRVEETRTGIKTFSSKKVRNISKAHKDQLKTFIIGVLNDLKNEG